MIDTIIAVIKFLLENPLITAAILFVFGLWYNRSLAGQKKVWRETEVSWALWKMLNKISWAMILIPLAVFVIEARL